MNVLGRNNILIERSLLALLCGAGRGAQLREEILSGLKGYRFQSVEHQVLFDCLQAMPLGRPELIRELLPGRLARAGFPDFDLEPYFGAGELSDEEARMLCQVLRERQTEEQKQVPRRDLTSG